MKGFRFYRQLKLPYQTQGLVFFVSQNYNSRPEAEREYIKECCRAAAPKNYEALLEYVTTPAGGASGRLIRTRYPVKRICLPSLTRSATRYGRKL